MIMTKGSKLKADAAVAKHRMLGAFKLGGMIGGALAAGFFMISEPANADTPAPSAPITISSVQSADFAKLSQNKILLVVSPDFSKIAIKIFEKNNPGMQVVYANDVPSKRAAFYVNGSVFKFRDLEDSPQIEFFEAKELPIALNRLNSFMEDHKRADFPTSQPG